MVENTFDRKIR